MMTVVIKRPKNVRLSNYCWYYQLNKNDCRCILQQYIFIMQVNARNLFEHTHIYMHTVRHASCILYRHTVRHASCALQVMKRWSSYLRYDSAELDYVRRQVQIRTDKSRVSSQQYADTIANLEALQTSASAKAASEIIDEICLHTEQCKSVAA